MSQFDATAFVVPVTQASATAGAVTLGTVVLPFAVEIIGLGLFAGTGPVGSAQITQVTAGGVNAYTSAARLSVAAGATQGSVGAADNVGRIAANTPIQVNVAQAGSTTPAANVTYSLVLKRA